MSTKVILLTGATGFLGKVLLPKLSKYKVITYGRSKPENVVLENFYKGGIDSSHDFWPALENITAVIHCAARVHVMNDSSANPLEKFREVNTQGTLNLAQQAADVGVKRFIFISTIKVNGESTELGFPFKYDDSHIPTDPYGLSKYEAEVGLRKIAKQTGMEVVIIRPPLVYGPGVKANFASMMKWVNKGLPLPLGGITENKRSLVSVDNLVDLIITCIDHPKAANETFFISDGEDFSTPDLIRQLSHALNKKARLFPCPVWSLRWGGRLLGKQNQIARLTDSLQVSTKKALQQLDWQPPISAKAGLEKTVCWYQKSVNNYNR